MSANEKHKTLFEKILNRMTVAVTCVDANGNILYAYPAAKKRPSKTPRDVGINTRECHKEESNQKIDRIFTDFRNGRDEPHHYISSVGQKRHLVTMIPIFEDGLFSGCVSHNCPLTFEGPERSF